MNDDYQLNKMLKAHKVAPPSTNLSARIIAAAALNNATQNRKPLWQVVIQEVMKTLYIPKPAYALAFSLVFGVFLGFLSGVDTAATSQDWFSIFDSATDLTGEDWL